MTRPLERRVVRLDLMRGLNRLGADQRECVMLRFLRGMSVEETAEITGRNSGAVDALQHRAIRKLADLVGGQRSLAEAWAIRDTVTWVDLRAAAGSVQGPTRGGLGRGG